MVSISTDLSYDIHKGSNLDLSPIVIQNPLISSNDALTSSQGKRSVLDDNTLAIVYISCTS